MAGFNSSSAQRYWAGDAVELNDTTYTVFATIPVVGGHGYARIQVEMPAGVDMSALKAVRSMSIGGVAAGNSILIAENTDFDAGGEDIPTCYPANAYLLDAPGSFQFEVLVDNTAEIGLYAKCAAGTPNTAQVTKATWDGM